MFGGDAILSTKSNVSKDTYRHEWLESFYEDEKINRNNAYVTGECYERAINCH